MLLMSDLLQHRSTRSTNTATPVTSTNRRSHQSHDSSTNPIMDDRFDCTHKKNLPMNIHADSLETVHCSVIIPFLLDELSYEIQPRRHESECNSHSTKPYTPLHSSSRKDDTAVSRTNRLWTESSHRIEDDYEDETKEEISHGHLPEDDAFHHVPHESFQIRIDSAIRKKKKRHPWENVSSKSLPIACPLPSPDDLRSEELERDLMALYNDATWRMYHRIIQARQRRPQLKKSLSSVDSYIIHSHKVDTRNAKGIEPVFGSDSYLSDTQSDALIENDKWINLNLKRNETSSHGQESIFEMDTEW